MTDGPERLVIRAPNWLGDAVLALPAMAAVRRQFPTASLTVAAAPSIAPLFRAETDVVPDEVLELLPAAGDRPATLGGGRFTTGILFPNSFRSAWQFWRAGIPRRWGYPTAGRGLLLTTRSRPARRRGLVHQCDYFRDLVRGLDIACADDQAPRVRARPAADDLAATLLVRHRVDPDARLVGIAPGAAYGQAKQWPPERMAALIATLVGAARVTAVVVGAAHDRDAARAIESWLRAHAPAALGHVVDLTGQTSLGSLIALIQRTAVFVSNDSGAMHVAAAAGRPVVAIFGPTNEAETRPIGDHDVLVARAFCRPCMLRDCPIDHRCMTRITIERVAEAVGHRLAGAKS